MTSLTIQAHDTENPSLETSATQNPFRNPLQQTQHLAKIPAQQPALTVQALDECCSFGLDPSLCAFVCMSRYVEEPAQNRVPDYVKESETDGTGRFTASRMALETVVDVARRIGKHRQHKDCGSTSQQSCSAHDEHAALVELGQLRTSDCKSYDVFADQCGSNIADIRLRGVSSDVDSYFQQMLQMYGWDNLTGDVKDVVTTFMTAWISLMDHCMREPSYTYIESEARVQRGNWSTYHEECKHSAWRYERIGHSEAFHMAEVNYGWLHAHSIDSDSRKLCNPKCKAVETLMALDYNRVMTGADLDIVQHINELVRCLSEAEDIEPVSDCATLCNTVHSNAHRG
ncbi:hypothetical protein BGX26_012985 [Mortierella sp. AD094]|nr:hypothetical protein BGX26_012985 [Mortierella sp. AD094]